jgi:hypothetical protein
MNEPNDVNYSDFLAAYKLRCVFVTRATEGIIIRVAASSLGLLAAREMIPSDRCSRSGVEIPEQAARDTSCVTIDRKNTSRPPAVAASFEEGWMSATSHACRTVVASRPSQEPDLGRRYH